MILYIKMARFIVSNSVDLNRLISLVDILIYLLVERLVQGTININSLEVGVGWELVRVVEAIGVVLCSKDLPFHIQWCLYEYHRVTLVHAFESYQLWLIQCILVCAAAKTLHIHTIHFDHTQLTSCVDNRLVENNRVSALRAVLCGNMEYTVFHINGLTIHFLNESNVRQLISSNSVFLLCRIKGNIHSFYSDILQFGISR